MSDAGEPIPNAVPHLTGNEWRYLKECLDTNWVSSAGPFVDRFEREVAAYVGARHAIAVASGTAALHAGLLGAGVAPGDEVLVPTLTFVATANAIRYCGAWPVFMDSDPETWTMDVAKMIREDYLQQSGPWAALLQPGVYVATRANISNYVFNPSWRVNPYVVIKN